SRRLAADLAVHFNTVAQAYRDLEQEGWLELRRKHGTVVRDRPLPQPARGQRESLQADLQQDLERLVSRYRSLGLEPGRLAGMLRETLHEIEGE
ncbi:MAG TPA: GntR family transcriptional regulator, partial [Gammaproteobacteria bacterium]